MKNNRRKDYYLFTGYQTFGTSIILKKIIFENKLDYFQNEAETGAR